MTEFPAIIKSRGKRKKGFVLELIKRTSISREMQQTTVVNRLKDRVPTIENRGNTTTVSPINPRRCACFLRFATIKAPAAIKKVPPENKANGGEGLEQSIANDRSVGNRGARVETKLSQLDS